MPANLEILEEGVEPRALRDGRGCLGSEQILLGFNRPLAGFELVLERQQPLLQPLHACVFQTVRERRSRPENPYGQGGYEPD